MVIERREGQGIGQRELLPGRQADEAGEGDLLFGEIVLYGDEALLFGLQFHLAAGDVDARGDAGVVAVEACLNVSCAVADCARVESTRDELAITCR